MKIEMKKLLLLMLFAIFTTNILAQLTTNPTVNSTNASSAAIGAVILSPEETGIALAVSIGYDEWVRISAKTVVQYTDPNTGTLVSLPIRGLENINGGSLTLGTKYTYLPNNIFILRFPPLPRNVSRINLIEDGSWKWYGINFSPRSDVVVKRLATSESEINKLIALSKNSNAGIYEQLSASKFAPSVYRLAFVQNESGTFLLYVSSEKSVGDWKCGEIKAVLRPTISNNIYKADWYMANKQTESAVITFDGATMKLIIGDDANEDVYVRMSNDTGGNSQNANIYSEKWSGTGFALKNGYILTNHHVIDEANTIDIFGVGGDFSHSYKAKVIGSDKVNDLALLKISESGFKGFGNIPYSFKSKLSDVGEDIYVLGYPLTATMGEEIKLTNGIISAKTGFDGDVSQYQISAPVQPGNSGGPLLDYNGNVIGVICAKHRGAENVTYAIKTSQVRNLIESVSDLSIMNTTNQITGKALKDQVKLVNKFVYIIKCSK